MSNIPNLNDMLKLYTKKDLWDRVQEKNQIIANLNQQIHALQEQLDNAIVPPKGFDIGQIIYMIPNSNNGLKDIRAYRILQFSFSDIGCRVDLSLQQKEKGIEPYYSAGFERFGSSIFATYKEAEQRLAELKEDNDD